ncbi:hypothetical protein Holit_01383 [Hollandina sp. SP2]
MRALRGLSDYASDIFTTRLLALGAFTLVEQDRAVLRGIETESAYQLSGNVDHASMTFIGHQVGAQVPGLGVLNRSGCKRETAKDESIRHESTKILPIEEKERFRWRESLERSRADIPCRVREIRVWNREGDRYEVFAATQSLKEPLLIQIVQNRMTVEPKWIGDEIGKKGCQGRGEVRLSLSSIAERDASYSVKRPHMLNPVKSVPGSIAMQVSL